MKGRPPIICHRPWTSAFIRLDGAVTFCCHLPRPEAVLGNLNRMSFAEMWDSPLARQMRGCFLNGHLPAYCRQCPLVEVRDRAALAARWRPFGVPDEEPHDHLRLPGEGALYHPGSGWWDAEESEGMNIRWSQSKAELLFNRALLIQACSAAQSKAEPGLLFTLHAVRGDDAPHTRLHFQWANEGDTHTFEMESNSRTALFLPLPAVTQAGDGFPTMPLTLVVDNPWFPHRCLEDSQDERELGVMLIEIQLTDRRAAQKSAAVGKSILDRVTRKLKCGRPAGVR